MIKQLIWNIFGIDQLLAETREKLAGDRSGRWELHVSPWYKLILKTFAQDKNKRVTVYSFDHFPVYVRRKFFFKYVWRQRE